MSPLAAPESSLKTLTFPEACSHLVNPVVRDVREEDIAVRIDSGSFRELVALADHFPIERSIGSAGREGLLRLGDWSGPVTPNPTQGIGQEGTTVLHVVAFGAHHQLSFVTSGVEGGNHVLIAGIHIARAVLQKDSQRLSFELANL